ncbi:hypothetical protein SmJEL517_g05970 [Synchytrium microbalum]|uniref:mannan endo-1,4-beta-mannosidase n=1 Tax=Synchytrium microbalum TaxID=1806994 RepID=A0A507BI53_9FUNG|nr:uncharacterized protein SmJEL517_g05970 [Synchytrium microbalum]TPX30460.1 hypothetical protein SmJEL517_g05970 [Synchytrium microbalum]
MPWFSKPEVPSNQQDPASRQAVSARERGFIYCQGTILYEYDKPFRFISWNVPNIQALEDGRPDQWERAPSPWEQEDALASVHQMQGRVIRTYTLSVGKNRHIESPTKLNEALFIGLDHAIAIASRYNIRVIIPIIDNWEWHGGVKDFAAFRGKRELEFWTDSLVRNDFKQVIQQVILRRNTVTGVVYRDDPTILGFETGNELGGWDYSTPSDWTIDICKFIRSIDQNHIIIDGSLGTKNQHWPKEVLQSPYVDAIDNHYYSPQGTNDYANQAKNDLKLAKKYNKAFFCGEFGLASPKVMEAMLDTVVKNQEIAGALIWSLRFHAEQGGFYTHKEYEGYLAYHYPGFPPAEGFHPDEQRVIKMMRTYSAKLYGRDIPIIPAPPPPYLYPSRDARLTWRGSVGASHYQVWRTYDGGRHPWQMIADGIVDNVNAGNHIYKDTDVSRGVVYVYSVVAVSEGGRSEYSNRVMVES